MDISQAHGKTPYALIRPFIDRVSVVIVKNIQRRPDIMVEATSLVGQSRQSFIQTTLHATLPALVMARERDALATVASVVGQDLGPLLLDHMAEILTYIFLRPRQTDSSIEYLVGLFADRLGTRANNASTASLIASCHMNLAVALIIELGDEDPKISGAATEGLEKAQYYQSNGRRDTHLAQFLRPVMLGIMTHLNETLHDMRGKKTIAFKRKLIRSIGALIFLVGQAMSAYSPQVRLQASLSMISADELRSWQVSKAPCQCRSSAVLPSILGVPL